MKTIEQGAIEHCSNKYFHIGCISKNSFIAGGIFVQRWIPVTEDLPDVGIKVLVKTRNNNVVITSMYIPRDILGNVLGEKEWRGSSSFKHSVIEWRPIEYQLK